MQSLYRSLLVTSQSDGSESNLRRAIRDEHVVCVLDADRDAGRAGEQILTAAGLRAHSTTDVEEALELFRLPGTLGCLVSELHLNGIDGRTLLPHHQDGLGPRQPVVIFTRDATVKDAVDCIKLGAFDFIEKSSIPEQLIQRVGDALLADAEHSRQRRTLDEARGRLARLSAREKELAGFICRGQSSKQIAMQLSISVKTVSNHRSHLLRKLGAENTADLVWRIVSCMPQAA